MRCQAGVTLTELLIGIIIISILSVVVATNLTSGTDAADQAALEGQASSITSEFVLALEQLVPDSGLLPQAVVLAGNPALSVAITAALDMDSDGRLTYSEVLAANPVELARTLAPSFGGTPTDPNVASDQAVQAAFGDYIAGVLIAQEIAGENPPGTPLAEILADPIRFLLAAVPLMNWPSLILMATASVVSGQLLLRRRGRRRRSHSTPTDP